ncbi:peptidylprolyl isomerase [Novosphingobium sp. ERN07]|uniref:peptidylprolyl isomerase n=1 Tax=Novosphingobium sp. ERN07 TaxID=2726187 RepID=UPI001F0D206C|nr:peptidylprolyl isomerase [Novosphingobium sp. ERN07]
MSLLALLAALAASSEPVSAPEKALAPAEIVAAAPAADWITIAPSDLLVMDLAPDAQGKARRVVIQLLPAPFSQRWVGNIRKLAAAHWWDGTSINRAQDNYVVQWGDPDGEDKVKAKALPEGLVVVPQGQYAYSDIQLYGTLEATQNILRGIQQKIAISSAKAAKETADEASGIHIEDGRRVGRHDWFYEDVYSDMVSFFAGWPIGSHRLSDEPSDRPDKPDTYTHWPIHCYGTIGVGRNEPPDTGTGAELYAVIGHAAPA